MSYQAIYRAWRPQTFSDLVGQPHVRQTLTNAILRGQVAHAYLFCGPRGTGKTSAAKVLAKAVNCEALVGADPCNRCEACESINQGTNVDVEEIDAASNRGVDEIRQLRDKVQYAPASLRRKVYIVDEVHMLTTEAFNALLKTLEEPPAHTLFVLATTEPHKIPATIISRCQRFDFRRIEPEAIVERLSEVCEKEGWQAEPEALWRIAHAADGGLRDALGLLEQTAAFAAGAIRAADAAHVMGGVETEGLLGLVTALAQGDVAKVLADLAGWYRAGKDPGRIVHDLLQTLRDVFVVKLSGGDAQMGPLLGAYQQAAVGCSQAWLLTAVKKLGETYTSMRYVEQPRLALEAALLTVATEQPPQTVPERADGTRARTDMPRPGGAGPSAVDAGDAPAGRAPVARAGDESAGRAPVAPAADASTEGDTGGRGADSAPAPRRSAAGQSRKMQVLKQLAAAANADVLTRVQAAWPDVLQWVRGQQIQAHAWLMGGEPVLATEDTVVIAFASRIHRDAVMKPNVRTLIEQALSEGCGAPLRFLALHRPDWEAFSAEQKRGLAQAAGDDGQSLVAKAVEVFGQDVLEIIDGE
ncbi:DNA polymerase III subunit gamma/tau [Alicyclobacillus shizuokensis]|uniref:DNA polymerase III subunit gamma/tau n=1 Tax=Alicyclobacillus shizuokensis TaxID=392014 RepID=UPI00082F0AC2|nr:DNA polymerase III subunit gamma/tau [Alicyclobacillus shizuokensis]